MVGANDAELGHAVGMIGKPRRSGFFQSSLEDVQGQFTKDWKRKGVKLKGAGDDSIVSEALIESMAQLYRDRTDCEKPFDELKKQWGRAGLRPWTSSGARS